MNTTPSNTHRRVLVTGGAGFIGSNFIRYAPNAHPDWQIVNFDKLTYAGNLANLQDVEDHPDYRIVRGDIADRPLVDELFQTEHTEHFDVVYGTIDEGYFTEDSSIQPNSPYAASKASGDLLCRAFHRTYQFPVKFISAMLKLRLRY